VAVSFLSMQLQLATREVEQSRRSPLFPPSEIEQNHQLFNELYCYGLQNTELKLLHYIL